MTMRMTTPLFFFDPVLIGRVKSVIDMSHDFIYDYYHQSDRAMYLKFGLLIRLLEKTKTEDERKNILSTYGYMANESSDKSASM